MEEKYEEYKKSGLYKKKVITTVFLVILFLAIVASGVYFYLQYNSPKKKVNENKNYFYEIKDNTVSLLSSDGLEETYACKSTCEIYLGNNTKGYFDKGRIILKDGFDVYLYDLLNNKKLSENYNRIDFVLDGKGTETGNIKMFKVNNNNGRQGVIDLKGNVLVAANYEELGKTIDENFSNYSYEGNYITAKADGKWGMISLTNGKGLIDYQYEDIKLSPYNKLTVKEDGLWYVVDTTNKKIIQKGYSSVDIYQEYLVVSENKKAYISDYSGNTASNKIDIYYDVDPWAVITIKGLSTSLEDDKIHLFVDVPIDVNAGTYKTVEFYYDAENNEIKSV